MIISWFGDCNEFQYNTECPFLFDNIIRQIQFHWVKVCVQEFEVEPSMSILQEK